MSANDKQIGGKHYAKHGQHQPWDVLQSWLTPEGYRGWIKGNAIVYLAREGDKGGDQDIAKAGHMLEKLVEVLAARPAPEPLPPIVEPVKGCDTCRHNDNGCCENPGAVCTYPDLVAWEACK